MSRHARIAAIATAAVVLLVAGGLRAATSSDEASAVVAGDVCSSPITPDHAAAESYAACRASELAGVLSSLPPVPTSTVTATETATQTVTETATVTATATATATQTVTATPTPEPAKKIIGLSAPDSTWSQRLAEVGADGIRARRIFGDLTSSGQDRAPVIQQALADGMLPVVSYKVPSVTNAIAGQYDTWAQNAAAFLDGLGAPVAVVIWHEPRGDMTQAQYLALQKRLVPIFQSDCAQCEVGPILNGFLLTGTNAQKAEWPTWSDAELLDEWDWLGMDVYQTTSGGLTPGDRIDPLLTWLASVGHPDMAIGIGEYNARDASAIASSGEKFLSTPTLWFASFWDSGDYVPLTGDRLAAFQATKADPRALQ